MQNDRSSGGGGSAAPAWRVETEIAGALRALLARVDLAQPHFQGALAQLVATHGEAVFSELLDVLCHLRFEPDEAREHWWRIVEHRSVLEAALGTAVDVRVALASYFLQVNRKLKCPKMIELQLFEQTQAQVICDELTGLANHRYFTCLLDSESERHRRHGLPLSLAMIDLDEFKHFNDAYGHPAGNEVLAAVAALLRASVRDGDTVARYGGEEFAIVFPATGKDLAALVSERVRTAIERRAFPAGSSCAQVTVSIGLATLPADAATGPELVRAADRALYDAKAGGRNCVRLCDASRRSFRRTDCSVPATVHVASPAGLPVCVSSLSPDGLGFRSSVPLAPGTVLELRLALPNVDAPVRVVGRVATDTSVPDSGHAIGVQFEGIRTTDRCRLVHFLDGQTEAVRRALQSDLVPD